jgi:hypothetical protein
MMFTPINCRKKSLRPLLTFNSFTYKHRKFVQLIIRSLFVGYAHSSPKLDRQDSTCEIHWCVDICSLNLCLNKGLSSLRVKLIRKRLGFSQVRLGSRIKLSSYDGLIQFQLAFIWQVASMEIRDNKLEKSQQSFAIETALPLVPQILFSLYNHL